MASILVFGTFDLLHEGHKAFFRQAKQHGDHLTVVVARDETVKRVKGKRPVHTEEERVTAVEKILEVDEVILGSLGDKFQVVRDIAPDVICLGYDQEHFVDDLEQFIQQEGYEIDIVRLKAFEPEKYKSSLMRKKIK